MAIWDGVEEFLAVAETNSFTQAAKRLRVSASHVSRQVALLEERLGVRLFARSTRVVRLTPAGADYFGRVSVLADGLVEANQVAMGEDARISGRIRVSAAGPFAEYRVAPALADFTKQFPGVSIEIDFNSRRVNLIEEGFDFAIRYGELEESGLIARKLTGRPMICMASKAYLDARGRPRHPTDLRDHDCLITSNDRWSFTDRETEKALFVRVNGRWQANNLHAIRAGLVEGLGIAYATEIFLEPFVNDDRFERLLEGYEEKQRASWIIYPEKRLMPTRVKYAIDHLINHFKA